MVVYNWLHVLDATVAYFDFVSIDHAIVKMVYKAQKQFPIIVETLFLNGKSSLTFLVNPYDFSLMLYILYATLYYVYGTLIRCTYI